MVEVITKPRGPIAAEPAEIIDLLLGWLSRRITPEAMNWLVAEVDRQRAGPDERRVALALGLSGRKVGRTDLLVNSEQAVFGRHLRADWQPETLGTDEAARVAILLATYRGDDQAFAARVDSLCTTAEVTEYVAYLKGFAVFPAGRQLHDRAREGVRSSIRPVFEAIACQNPYPFDFFDEAAWNQMVVKCVFTGASIDTIVGTLSGGNQQKVVLAKWLSMKPRVVIFDEPTRGIDVGSKSEIYRLMRGLADAGVAVLMISSDMEEVIGVSDRIVVMREGRIAGFLERAEFSEENVMRLAVGRRDMREAEAVTC